MSAHDDKVFLQRFSLIIIGLVLFTVVIFIIANNMNPEMDADANPSRAAKMAERVQPVGAVHTEVPAEPVAAATVAAAPLDGPSVYAQVCQVCHTTGAAGAPIPGSDLWKERAAKGLEALVSSALNGLNAMPAKGGRTDLSDAEIQAAVEHMLTL